MPVDELLLKKRSPSKTNLKTHQKPKKSAQPAVAEKPTLKHRTFSKASNATSSISSHESYGSEHSVSGRFTNVGFNEAQTHYIAVPFGARAKNTYHRSRDGKKSKPGLGEYIASISMYDIELTILFVPVLTQADFGRPEETIEKADLVVAGGMLNQHKSQK